MAFVAYLRLDNLNGHRTYSMVCKFSRHFVMNHTFSGRSWLRQAIARPVRGSTSYYCRDIQRT